MAATSSVKYLWPFKIDSFSGPRVPQDVICELQDSQGEERVWFVRINSSEQQARIIASLFRASMCSEHVCLDFIKVCQKMEEGKSNC
jgi:hypothetical protein